MELPLSGIRVLDFTHVVAGPYATMMLADMGAEVVKVERPEGDDLRRVRKYAGRAAHDEDYFYSLNRSKRSIVLDLKTAANRETAHRLAALADVVIQNFAPGTAERLGIGSADLCSLNSKLVYCALSGFGQTGPLRSQPALDPIVQARSGIMSVTGDPDGLPTRVGAPIGDVVAGMYAAYAILGGVLRVRRGGEGCFIDISLLDTLIAVLGPRMAEALQASRKAERVGNENAIRAPGGMFEAGDGEYVVFEVQQESHWGPFCRALKHNEWHADPRFATMGARLANREALNSVVAEAFKTRPAAAWLERLVAERVPAAPVYDYLQALADPQVVARQLVVSVEHPRSGTVRLVGAPWRGTLPVNPAQSPPLLGEHAADVLRDWLGRGELSVATQLRKNEESKTQWK